MKLILVRHGETFENYKDIIQGHLNSQLSKRGIKQAKKVALSLRDQTIDVAFSSDLDRAMNTFKEILKFHPKTRLISSKKLREQSKGIFEGKNKFYLQNHINDNQIFYPLWKPEGGERLTDVWDRVTNFFEKIKIKYKNKTILFVSHGGTICCLLAYLENKTIERSKDYLLKNTTVSIINMDNERITFEKLNCMAHLE